MNSRPSALNRRAHGLKRQASEKRKMNEKYKPGNCKSQNLGGSFSQHS